MKENSEKTALSPESFSLLLEEGAYLFEGCFRDNNLSFDEWSELMRDNFKELEGFDINPYLEIIWEQAGELIHQGLLKDLNKKIAKTAKSGASDSKISGYARKLFYHFRDLKGITDSETLVIEVHNVIKKHLPEMTIDETKDAITRMGKYDPKLKRMKREVEQLRRELVQKGYIYHLETEKITDPGILIDKLYEDVKQEISKQEIMELCKEKLDELYVHNFYVHFLIKEGINDPETLVTKIHNAFMEQRNPKITKKELIQLFIKSFKNGKLPTFLSEINKL